MAPWHTILCCSELRCLPHNPRYIGVPPTANSTKHLDFLLSQGAEIPRKDDPKTPLTLKDYHEGITSVARMGDLGDEHWPVRYFTVWVESDQTLGGFIEIDDEKVEIAEAQETLEERGLPKADRFYGECPNHPALEFYVRYHPLREKPAVIRENEEEEKRRTGDASPSLSDLIPISEADTWEPKIWGDFPYADPLKIVLRPCFAYPRDSPPPAEEAPVEEAAEVPSFEVEDPAEESPDEYPSEDPAEDPAESMFMELARRIGNHNGCERPPPPF